MSEIIKNLDSSSGPGLSEIPTKIIKAAVDTIAPIFTELFNDCFTTSNIPIEWKSAVVTPLFKKGDPTEINNYRGISVLPPISKVFEKLICLQITSYFLSNNLFFKGQHGFRKNHSCETALHELLTDINNILDKSLIMILLFIDFRKAFDLVDSNLLLLKLFHYGFDNLALDLISNYFQERQQTVKNKKTKSSFKRITLGVPQ